MNDKQTNEGEGNRTAARVYNEATEKFAKSGRVQEQAELAEKAVDSEEKADLDRAELVGKSKARGEDPAVERKGVSPQKVDETKIALRELGPNDSLDGE